MMATVRRAGVLTLVTSIAVLTGIGAATLIDWCLRTLAAVDQHAETQR